MHGGEADDETWAGAGKDRMTGGESAGSLLFSGLPDRDTITGVSVTHDRIQIRVSGVDEFDDLRFSRTTQGDAIVSRGSLAAGSSVARAGVPAPETRPVAPPAQSGPAPFGAGPK
jgi:Ca2+-binding RTX toxin-like protein